mgnify:CR=1 FL=1
MAEESVKNLELMDKIVSLCKRRGFVFPSSEIYGGINGFWDYGPYGARMKRAVENLWWHEMVETRDNVEGLDSTIICHPRVWKASGHLDQFSDLMTDCRKCKSRYRVDQMEDPTTCPNCGSKDLTEPREFNLMMKTFVGPVFDEEHAAYLRAETCQPIFVDFHSVRVATRQKLPFGIAQIGKAFRNEINPRNFTFRSREFTQMEMEFFCDGEEGMEWFEYWKQQRINYYKNKLKFSDDFFRIYVHEKLAHYANAATDIEFHMPFGFKEVEGIHSRTDFDLSQHEKFSGRSIKYFDPDTNESYTPYDIETSIGVDRMFLTILCHSYTEEKLDNGSERIVLRLPEPLAPVKCAVLPLVNKDGLPEKAQEIVDSLKFHFNTHIEVKDSIGKRYRRQDAIGTPFCVTVDGDTLTEGTVTLRYRDSMKQERVPVEKLREIIEDRVSITSLLKKLQ